MSYWACTIRHASRGAAPLPHLIVATISGLASAVARCQPLNVAVASCFPLFACRPVPREWPWRRLIQLTRMRTALARVRPRVVLLAQGEDAAYRGMRIGRYCRTRSGISLFTADDIIARLCSVALHWQFFFVESCPPPLKQSRSLRVQSRKERLKDFPHVLVQSKQS